MEGRRREGRREERKGRKEGRKEDKKWMGKGRGEVVFFVLSFLELIDLICSKLAQYITVYYLQAT